MHEHKKNMYHIFTVGLILDRLMREQNEGKATIFFEIMGHCQILTVRIFAPAWESGAEPSYEDELYLDTKDDERIDGFKTRLFTYLNTL